MSAGEERQAALVPAQSTALTKTGAKSLAARGRADLRVREEAEEWLQKGLEFHHQQRYEDAFRCFERGIELNPNHPEIQFMLDLSFDEGFVRPRNNATARAWYRKAAEQGIKEAQYNLGLLYYGWDDGPGLLQNYEQAASWFRKSAEQGDERAQWRLSFLLGLGLVVPQNHAEICKAAEQGNKDAQGFLGDLYRDGEGVPQDYAQAALWYRKAAEQGDEDAQAALDAMRKTEPNQRPVSMKSSAEKYPALSEEERAATIQGFEATKGDLHPSVSGEVSGEDDPSGGGGTVLT